MSKMIGTKPNQIPTNSDLGSAAYINHEDLPLSDEAKAVLSSLMFNSVSEMKTATKLKVGMKVRTLGYYTLGDGGGNDYEIVAAGTGTDDGGSFIDLSGSGLQAKGLFEKGVSVTQFGARTDGTSDASPAINAALAFAAERDMREVSAIGRFLLLNPVVFPRASQNLVLVGGGSAPLASQRSSTYFDYQGPVDDSVAVVKVEGRSSGSAVRGIYINCNERAGDGLLLQSVFAAAYSDVVIQNYRKRGLVLTIHPDAPGDSWYTSKNTFDRIRVTSGFPGAQALHLLGVKTETRRNGIWGNVFSACTLIAVRVLDKSLLPAAVYLGYCDSNEFIKCDIGLSGGVTTERFAASLHAMVDRDGANLVDGQDWFVRDILTPYDEVPPTFGPRWTGIYRFDSSSTETPDGVNVLAPRDNVGRFIKYQGAGIVIDGNEFNRFPANNCFHHCSVSHGEAFVDVTSNGNVPGSGAVNTVPSCNMLPYATFDGATIPHHIKHVGGVTDNGRVFGYDGWDVSGGPLLITDYTHLHRTKFVQNSSPNTGNSGLNIILEDRMWDSSEWEEITRLTLTPDGLLEGPAVTQTNFDTTTGRLMRVGDFGLGASRSLSADEDIFNNVINGFYRSGGSDLNKPEGTASGGAYIRFGWGTGWGSYIYADPDLDKLFFHNTRDGTHKGWKEIYHSGNTTVDGNGFIKAASPILRLYSDRIEVEGEFHQKPQFERVSKGVYKITGTLGLRIDDGWYLETPADRNGNKYFNIDWEQNIEPENQEGVVDTPVEVELTIRTYERVWNPKTGIYENGNPVDINDQQERFVSLRFNELRKDESSNPLDNDDVD